MEIKSWDNFTDEELQKALTLMVRPEWMKERKVVRAVLVALDYNADDVAEVLASGQPLHDGLPGKWTDFTRIHK